MYIKNINTGASKEKRAWTFSKVLVPGVLEVQLFWRAI